MRPGRLDTLLTPRTTSTTWSGGVATTAAVRGTAFWAHVSELTGREVLRAGINQGELPAVITYRADDATVTADMTLTDGAVVYEVRTPPRRVGGPRGLYAETVAVVTSEEGA